VADEKIQKETEFMEHAQSFVDQELIVLSKNGTWLANGIEVTHPSTVRLFAKNLKRDDQGYFIQVGKESKRIQVEDTPYFIRKIEGNAQSGYLLFINDETEERLDPMTVRYQPGRLTCRIKSQTSEAKFLHAAYMDLLKDLRESETTFFLEFGIPENRTLITLADKMSSDKK
jgi:hypothetical protein